MFFILVIHPAPTMEALGEVAKASTEYDATDLFLVKLKLLRDRVVLS